MVGGTLQPSGCWVDAGFRTIEEADRLVSDIAIVFGVDTFGLMPDEVVDRLNDITDDGVWYWDEGCLMLMPSGGAYDEYVAACLNDECDPHDYDMWVMHGCPVGPIG